MKKKELIEQLTAAKTLTSTVDIDKVIGMIKQLETPTTITAELGSEIVSRIERCLDNNSHSLVDTDSAEFELDYDNRIRLDRVDVDVYSIIEHVTEIIDSYVELEDDEEETNDIEVIERLEQEDFDKRDIGF